MGLTGRGGLLIHGLSRNSWAHTWPDDEGLATIRGRTHGPDGHGLSGMVGRVDVDIWTLAYSQFMGLLTGRVDSDGSYWTWMGLTGRGLSHNS